MAGYIRQSVADIINGAEITAPPLNAEFNQLRNAFDGATGHAHDGSAGNAPQIELSTSVAGYLLPAHGGVGGRNNVTATSNPLVTSDLNAGYAPGSIWLNVTTNRLFVCVANTSSAAVWYEVVNTRSTNEIFPAVTNTVDIGTFTNRFKDVWLSGSLTAGGSVSLGGSFTVAGSSNLAGVSATSATVSGLSTLTQADINSGTIDGTVIGASSASPITGTQVTATTGFVGNVTGNVTGNITSSGTSSFNNVTASGMITGDLTGDVTGDIASSGTSTFNNVSITGTLNMDAATLGTITGLTTPVNVSDAATKGYVDTTIAAVIDAAPGALDTLNELAAALGDDPNFATTMTNALAGKVNDTGDTMTGTLTMSNGATVTGLVSPVNPTDAASKQYVDQQDALQVSRSGDSMSGSLSMGSNKITNLADPTLNTDATNKQYVDAILGSATAASASAAAAATSEANTANSEANALQSENDARDWAIKTDGTVDGINYSAKYWATQADVGTVATNIASINTSAANVASINLVGTSITAVNTVATNIQNVQDFFDTYFVSPTQPITPNVTVGDLWFDTTNNLMKVYSSGGWQNAGSSVNGTAERQDYTVGTSSGSYAGSLTTFPAFYDTGYVDVYLNGVKLAPSDFTATDGANVVLASAAASGDTISIVSFGTFELADHYNKAAVDALIDDVETLALAGL